MTSRPHHRRRRCVACGKAIERSRPVVAVVCLGCQYLEDLPRLLSEAEREATEAEESAFDAEHPASTGL